MNKFQHLIKSFTKRRIYPNFLVVLEACVRGIFLRNCNNNSET